MLRRLLLAPLVVVLACGGDSTGPKSLTLSGNWRQSGDLRDVTNGDSHIHIGTFALAQAGTDFSGSGEQTGDCITGASHYQGPLSDPAPFAITNGHLVGRTVSFQRDICSFQGSFVDGRNDRMTGTATCSYTLNGKSYSFAGQWQADRL